MLYDHLPHVDGIKRNPETARAILRSISRRLCTVEDVSAVASDLHGTANRKTVASYLVALRRINIIEDIPAWLPVSSSKARPGRTAKWNLIDPSIAVAILDATPEMLSNDVALVRSLFKSMCMRDLRLYSQPLGGRVYHYLDNSNLEADCIMELDDGRWAALNNALLSRDVDRYARGLLRMKSKIQPADGMKPSFLAVITGSGFYHERKDGVLVIPIGCLGP